MDLRDTDASAVAVAAPAPPGLAARARAAIAWSTGFQLFRDLFQFGLTLALVRLLPAEAYGQFGFVTTLVSFLTIYSFREFLNHTLQVRDGEPVPYQDHFTAGAVIQATLFLATNLLAVAASYVPAYAPAAPLIHMMSLIFPLDLGGDFRARMLERRLDWRRLRVLHGLGIVMSGAASIAMAMTGWGVYALFVPLLLLPLPLWWDLLVVEKFRPTWTFRWAAFRPAFQFGSSRMVAVTCVGGAVLIESSWLTGVFGFVALGFLVRANGLAQLVCGRVGGILGNSVYPVLTRVSVASASFTRASAMYFRAVSWVVVPMAVIVALLAKPIVLLLYGRSWMDAVPLVPLAVSVAAMTAIVQTVYTIVLAAGAHRRCLAADVWRLVGTVAALSVLVPFGLHAYLAGLFGVHAVAFLVVLDGGWRIGVLQVRAMIDALAPPVAATVGAAVLVYGLRDAASTSLPIAALMAALFGAAYFAILRLAFASQLRDLIVYLPEGGRLGRVLRLPAAA